MLWKYAMKCHNAGEIYRDGVWHCRECGDNGEIRRRPLTDYERMKLRWYRNENDWIDNIRDRKTVRDKFGRKITVSQGQILPMQPRELWKKPKGVE